MGASSGLIEPESNSRPLLTYRQHGSPNSQISELPSLTQTEISNRRTGRMSSRSSRTVYVGNLPGDIREREVEDLFSKYGPVVQIDLKVPPRPPGYAFVEFDDPRDAEDAIHGRDGYDFDGHRLRDHMRKGGDVCFSQVYRDGRGTTGVVDYTCYEDMKYAVKKLDDTEFRNAFSQGYVRVAWKTYIKISCPPLEVKVTFSEKIRIYKWTRKWELISGWNVVLKCFNTEMDNSGDIRSQYYIGISGKTKLARWMMTIWNLGFLVWFKLLPFCCNFLIPDGKGIKDLDLVQDQDLLYLLFRWKQARALASQSQLRALSEAGAHLGKM
ncbi:unnamed protein product [Arabis nemorensis]|uniref:RRM domain-containing protein n=1 Tax=Arabis nemorensis TaxID=586526 RepID=A0A565AK59_9BRAS|nr:unnamed protein product [Arabis nemorensis]